MDFNIPEELILEKIFIVKNEHSAQHLGSGKLAVLSTPSMILFMENVTRLCTDKVLPEGFTTVGTKVCISHLAAAPLGAKILTTTKLIEHIERKLTFTVIAWWEEIKIGEGSHERFIINSKRFLERLEEKLHQSNS